MSNPVAAAFSHRSIAFHPRVLCCVFPEYGKNSGDIRAAPYVQYHAENVLLTELSPARVEIKLLWSGCPFFSAASKYFETSFIFVLLYISYPVL